MIDFIKASWAAFFGDGIKKMVITKAHRAFLLSHVAFYQALDAEQQIEFARRCALFVNATEFIAHKTDINDEDKLLVAAGSVILAWGFDRWSYVKVGTVYLLGSSADFADTGGPEFMAVQGMVGTGHLKGKMILSKPALHYGFNNDRDKQNVALHEFSHLIDMADNEVDGLPEEIVSKAFIVPWLNLVEAEIAKIEQGKSNIRDYGATNRAEFFAVATEYFFERPEMLKRKHPEVYELLQQFYRQNLAL